MSFTIELKPFSPISKANFKLWNDENVFPWPNEDTTVIIRNADGKKLGSGKVTNGSLNIEAILGHPVSESITLEF